MAKHVFLVMSYGRPESQDVYETIVSAGEKAGRTLGDSVLTTRADDTVPKGSIVEHVHNHIRDADLIIGDTSGENPNVMWELGFAAALAKPMLIIAEAAENIPFGPQGYYSTLLYRSHDLRRSLGARLVEAIVQILESTDKAP